METEADIPQPIPEKKIEGEEKDFMSKHPNTTTSKISLEGMNNVAENMQIATNTEVENVTAVSKGNFGTTEGENFLESPLVPNKTVDDHQAAIVPNQGEKKVTEKAQKETQLENQHLQTIVNEEISLQEYKQTKEAMCTEQGEKGARVTDEKSESESSKQKLETSFNQNAEATVQTPDLTEELNIGSKHEPGSSLVTAIVDEIRSEISGLHLDGKLVENTIMEASKETVESSEKDMTSIKDEIQEITVIANSSSQITGKDDKNRELEVDGTFMKHEDCLHRESEKPAPAEALTEEYGDEEGFIVIVGEDNNEIEKHNKNKMSKHDEQSFLQKNDDSLKVASDYVETTDSNEHNVKEEMSIGSLGEILEETRKGKTINTDDIKEKEIPEEKTFSTNCLNEKTKSTEVEIPDKNASDLYITHLRVEEAALVKGQKHENVSTSESEQIHEATGVPVNREKRVNEAYEASNSLESTSLEHTSTEAAVAMELTTGKLQVKDDADNIEEENQQEKEASNTESQRTTRKSNDSDKCVTEKDVIQEDEDRENYSDHRGENETEDNDQNKYEEVNEDPNRAYKDKNAENQTKKQEETVTGLSSGHTAEETTKCSQEDETQADKSKAEMEEELETTSAEDSTGKNLITEERRNLYQSVESIEEETIAESSKENEMMAKMPRQEVCEIPQTAKEDANIGICIKEEDYMSKDNFTESAEEETKKEHSYVDDKEHDTKVNNNLEATESNKNTEMVRSKVAEDCNWESKASVMTKASEEEMKKLSEKPVDVMNSVSKELKEKTKEEKIEQDNCSEKIDTAPKMVTKETRLKEAQQNDKSVKATDTSSDAGNLKTIETTDTSLRDEVDITRLEETSGMVDQPPKCDHENAERGSQNLEKLDADEVEEVKTLEASSESKGWDVTENHETGEDQAVRRTEIEEIEEEIKGIPETRYHDVEATIDGDIHNNHTLAEEKLEEHFQVPSSATLSERTISTIQKIEDGNTKDSLPEFDSMKLEKTPEMEPLRSIIECDNVASLSITAEKSIPDETKLEEIKIFEALSESKVQSYEEIQKTEKKSTLGKLITDKVEEEIKENPETISEAILQGVESVANFEMIPEHTLPTEKSEEQLQVLTSASFSKEQEHETTSTIQKKEDDDTKENGTDVGNKDLKETSSIASEFSPMENQDEKHASATVENLDADEAEVGDTKTSRVVCESKDQDDKEMQGTGTSSTVGKPDADGMEEEIKEIPETLSEPVGSVTKHKMIPDQTLPAENLQEQHLVPSSALLSKEQEHETTTTIPKTEGNKTRKDKEVNSINVEETTGMVSQLSPIEQESAKDVSATIENSGEDEIEARETKNSHKICDPKYVGFQEIHEIGSSLFLGRNGTDKVEEKSTEVPEEILESKYQGIDAVVDIEIIPKNTFLAQRLEDQLQVPSSASLSKEQKHEIRTTIQQKEDDTEVYHKNLEETSGMVSQDSQIPHIEPENANNIESATGVKSDAEVEVGETKTSYTICDSKDQSVEEIQEIGTSPTAEKTDTDELEGKHKEVMEKISETRYQEVEPVVVAEVISEPTPPAEKFEEKLQLQLTASISTEQGHEISLLLKKIEDENRKKDEMEFDTLKLEGTSGMASQFQTIERENTDSVTEEKLETEEFKMKEETKEVPRTMSEFQVVETITDGGITTDQTLSAENSEEKLQMSSSALLPKEQDHETIITTEKVEETSKEKDAAGVDSMKLEENSDMISQLPPTENESRNGTSTTAESLAKDEVVETETSNKVSDSQDEDVKEIRESGTCLTDGDNNADAKKEEIKEVSETILGSKYHEEALTVSKLEEQHQEPSSALLPKDQDHETATTTEKMKDESIKKDDVRVNEKLDDSLARSATEETCGPHVYSRELEVSQMELELTGDTKRESPNEALKEEITAIEEVPAREPQEYVTEIKYIGSPSTDIHCSSHGTSNDEDKLDSTIKDVLPGEVVANCEEAANLELEKTERALESVFEDHGPEILIQPEETKIKREQLDAALTELNAKQTQCEETSAANEATRTEISSEKIAEEMDADKDSHIGSYDEETVAKSEHEDELKIAEEMDAGNDSHLYSCDEEPVRKSDHKNELKLSEEVEKASTKKDVTEIITCKDTVGESTATGSLPEEVNEGMNVNKASTQLSFKNQDDKLKSREIATEAMGPSEEVKSFEMVQAKHEGDITGANDKENAVNVVMTDKELPIGSFDIKLVTDAEEKLGLKTKDTCKQAPTTPIQRIVKTYEENQENAMTETISSESLMGDEKPKCQSLESAFTGSDVTEGLNLKNQETDADDLSTLSRPETLHKEIEDKEREKEVDQVQLDSISNKQPIDEVSTPEGKNITYEGEHMKDEEPAEPSTRGNETMLDEAEIHNMLTGNEEGETQVKIPEHEVLDDIKDSGKAIPQQDGIAEHAEVNETTKELQELEKMTFGKQIPNEPYLNTQTEAMISTGNKDVPLMQQDPTAETFQNAEVENLKAGNASVAESEAKRVECGEEKRMGNECEETTENSTSREAVKMLLSDHLQGSITEILQSTKQLAEEKELVVNKELKTNKAEAAEVEEAKTDDEEEEKGENDYKMADSISGAAVMIQEKLQEIEEEVNEDPQTVSQLSYRDIETVKGGEINIDQTLTTGKFEDKLQVPSSALHLKKEGNETITAMEKIEETDAKIDKAEVDSMKLKKNSDMFSQLPTIEHENINGMCKSAESLAGHEVEETKTSDEVHNFKDEDFKGIHESETSSAEGKNYDEKTEEEIKEVPETSGSEYHGFEAVIGGVSPGKGLSAVKLPNEALEEEITTCEEVPALEPPGFKEEIKEGCRTTSGSEYHSCEAVTDRDVTPEEPQHRLTTMQLDEKLQEPSSALLTKEQDHETTTEKVKDENTKKDNTQENEKLDNSLERSTTEVTCLPNKKSREPEVSEMEFKLTGDAEKQSQNEALNKDITALEEVPAVEPRGFEEEIKEVSEMILGSGNHGCEAVAVGEVTPEQGFTAIKSDEQLQEPSSALPTTDQDHETTTEKIKDESESATKDDTQLNEKLDNSSKRSTTEETRLPKEKSRELEVSEMEPKTTRDAERQSPNEALKEEITALEKVPAAEPHAFEEEIKEVPETTSGSEYHGHEAVTDSEVTPEQGLAAIKLDGRLQELSSALLSKDQDHEATTEKIKNKSTKKDDTQLNKKLDNILERSTEEETCFPKKTSTEPEASEMEFKLTGDTERESPNEAQEEEITPLEEVPALETQEYVTEIKSIGSPSECEKMDIHCSPQGTEDILDSTIKNVLPGQVVEKCEETANLKLQKTEGVLESVPEDHGRKALSQQEETIIKKEQLDSATIELKAKETQREETSETNETTRNEIPSEKTTEEMDAGKDIHVDSYEEETVTKSEQEDVKVKELPGEKVNETIEITKIIPYEELSEELERAGLKRDVTEVVPGKDRAVVDTYQGSVGDRTAHDNLSKQAKEKMIVKKAPIESDVENQDDETNGTETATEAMALNEKEPEESDISSVLQEPAEPSTSGNETKHDEAEIHILTGNEEGETQVKIAEHEVLVDIKDCGKAMPEHDRIVEQAKVNQTTKDIQELEKATLAISGEQILKEPNPNIQTEERIATGIIDVPLIQQDPTAETFQNAEIKNLKAGNALIAESEAKGVECGEEKRMGDECEETKENPPSAETVKMLLSDHVQGSITETSQAVKPLAGEKVNKELRTDETEKAEAEEAITNVEKDREEGNEDHKRADSGSDAPVMVEASRDMDAKIAQKKSYNILSSVGSKVMHSIAKVKKAIACKSSHSKSQSPK